MSWSGSVVSVVVIVGTLRGLLRLWIDRILVICRLGGRVVRKLVSVRVASQCGVA